MKKEIPCNFCPTCRKAFIEAGEQRRKELKEEHDKYWHERGY